MFQHLRKFRRVPVRRLGRRVVPRQAVLRFPSRNICKLPLVVRPPVQVPEPQPRHVPGFRPEPRHAPRPQRAPAQQPVRQQREQPVLPAAHIHVLQPALPGRQDQLGRLDRHIAVPWAQQAPPVQAARAAVRPQGLQPEPEARAAEQPARPRPLIGRALASRKTRNRNQDGCRVTRTRQKQNAPTIHRGVFDFVRSGTR